MPRRANDGRQQPSWEALYEAAAAQNGYFALEQAEAAGYSPQLLQYYVRAGKLERSHRGVFRLVHFPPSDREDLAAAWLWAGRQGVFGLETALSIHGLSDALPGRHDLMLPAAWAKRRLKPPHVIRLHFDDIPRSDWQWFGAVPVTTPVRTLHDCIAHHVQPDLIEQAFNDAIEQRIVSRAEARAIRRKAAA